MPTGDIPAVEAEIPRIRQAIGAHYTPLARAAVADYTDTLDASDLAAADEDRLAALALLLVFMVRDRVQAAPSAAASRRVRGAVQRLLLAGAASTGTGRGLRRAVVTEAVAEVTASAFQERRWSVETGHAERRAVVALRRAQEAVLARTGAASSAAVAEPVTATIEAPAVPSAPARPGAARPRTIQPRQPGRFVPPGPLPDDLLGDLRRDLNSVAWVGSRHIDDVIADALAYRAFNLGRYLSMRENGVRSFAAFNNPPSGPDGRTTPFCRNVHRQIVKVEQIEKSQREYFDAVESRDLKAALASWPLREFGEVSSRSEYRAVRSRVGLPPYHYRCRTVIVDSRVMGLAL